MTIEMLIEGLKYGAMLLLGGFALYFKCNNTLKNNVNTAINMAESAYKDTTKAGGQKFELAVNTLYNCVPAILKPIFTKEIIGEMVQSAFNEMQKYAIEQLNKITHTEI